MPDPNAPPSPPPNKNTPPPAESAPAVDPEMVADVQTSALDLAVQAGLDVTGLASISYEFDADGNVAVKAQSAGGAFSQTFPGDAVMANVSSEPSDSDPSGE